MPRTMPKIMYKVGGLVAMLAAILYHYPTMFYVIIFVAYSLLLVLLGNLYNLIRIMFL